MALLPRCLQFKRMLQKRVPARLRPAPLAYPNEFVDGIGDPVLAKRSKPAVTVLLGAYGDICSILPLLRHESLASGDKQHLVVADSYADLLGGCSYVEPTVFGGRIRDYSTAVSYAKRKFGECRIRAIQCYCNHAVIRQTDSFVKEMWRMAGRPDEWTKHPLIFDRRDPARELELALPFICHKPMILVAPQGFSSPFKHSADLMVLLTESFPDFLVVDLSKVRAVRPYDLLGLFDRAKAMVSIDTMHLHLSRASQIPVLALVADSPEQWHGAPAYSNQIGRVNYRNFEDSKESIITNLEWQLGMADAWPAKLIHVFNQYDRRAGANARHQTAARTWQAEYRFGNWRQKPILEAALASRNSSSLGDSRRCPFVHDLIDAACSGESHDQVIVLTNDDTCFVPGLSQLISMGIKRFGSAHAHRWDFSTLSTPLIPVQVKNGERYPGSDLFAFTKRWWKKNRFKYPDMIVGAEAWDWILRELILSTGGTEIEHAIYHQRHVSFWEVNRLELPSNRHNRSLARQWLTEHRLAHQELEGID